MTPKRFKAVCTETGREFGADDLVCGGYVRDDLYKPIGLYWSVEFEGLHQNTKIAEEVKLCQSTGLTDAKGQEVFFDDVLCLDGQIFTVDFDPHMFCAKIRALPPAFWILPMLDCGRLTVIGNRWQPAAELKARAEAVSNGQS